MQRSPQERRDIARMSAMKDAVQLISAFKDTIKVDGSDGIITTTTKIADKLVNWILQPIAETGSYDAPEPPVPEPRRDPTAYDTSRGSTFPAASGGKTISVKRCSKKQYGFLVALHRKLGREPDFEALNWISCKAASDLIEQLQYQVQVNGGGNGKGNWQQPPLNQI